MEQSRELGNIPLFIGSFDFLAPPLGMWDLSSPTRNQTILPTSGAQSLNHWMAWEVPGSFQFSPVPQSCPTLCDPMNCSMPGFPVHHQLLKLAQTHVHQTGDVIQPYHPLSSPPPMRTPWTVWVILFLRKTKKKQSNKERKMLSVYFPETAGYPVRKNSDHQHLPPHTLYKGYMKMTHWPKHKS